MADSATIVAASLSDKELRDSVTKLVNYFDDQMKIMAVSTNITVDSIEKKLKSLDKIKINSGGTVDGGSSRRTSSLKQEEQQVKSVATSYDGLAKAQQTAIGSRGGSALKKDIDEAANSYSGLIQQIERTQAKFDISPIQNLRMRQHELEAGMQTAANEAAKAKKDVDELNAAITNYRATLETLPKNGQGFSNRQAIQKEINDLITLRDVSSVEQQKWEAASRQLASQYEVVKNEIRQIGQALIAAEESEKHVTTELDKQLQKINEISSRKTATQTYRDAISMETNSLEKAESKLAVLQALKTKILNTDLLSKKDTESLTSYISYTTALVERMRSKTAKSTKDDEDAIRKAAEAEKRWADNIVARGQIAQETSRKLIRMLNEEAQAGGKGLMGMFKIDGKDVSAVKELEKAIKDMQMQYNQMSDMDKDSAIGRALKRDIENAKIASGVISGYNKAASGVFNRTSDSESFKIRNYETLKNVLKELTNQYNQVSIAEIKAGNANHIIDAIQRTSREAQQLQSIMNRPTSFASAMKLSEKTLDDLSYKIRQLQSYKLGIDLQNPNAANEIKQVDEAINRLQKDFDKYMAKANGVLSSNNALGRSWNYMKNRLAFYFSVGASTQFIKNLIEVRSQYEMNERALGILINSAERGTQIFNELSQMALVSPYTLIELSSAAKQLTAYDVAAKDVVDTTRRLADMAAAVGIPIERLTYALGQIKAYGYLNSRDARMFANAGIPLVKQLSEYYTQLEGRLVSTADVYDRIKKKSIDYNEVMEVMYKMTDQGGKFFDFQAKMADTLKVRLANLTLAWNNMLNDMGKESQGVLTWGIGALRDLFLRWKDLDKAIKNAAWIVGLKVALDLMLFGLNRAGLALGMWTHKMAFSEVVGKRLAATITTIGRSLYSLASSRMTWITLAVMAAIELINALNGANEAQTALNKSIRDGAKDNYDNISKFLEQYKQVRESLYTTQKVAIGNMYDPSTGKASATAYVEQSVEQDINKNEARKAWEAIREQIELTTRSSDQYIGRLLEISNMSERVRQGFNILEDVRTVNAALQELDEDTIKIEKDMSGWWNAYQLPDGLIGNIKDYQDELNNVIEKFGSLENLIKNVHVGGDNWGDFNDYQTALERLQSSVKTTTDSIINFIELKGWSGDINKINEVFKQIADKIALDNQLDPQKAFVLQTQVEEARSQAAKQALLQRINDEKAALAQASDENQRKALADSINANVAEYNNWDDFNGRKKVEWERFTKWLKEQHISETTAMFRNMDAEDIKSLNFQEGKHAEWVTRMVEMYAKEHKMSYDEAFNYLKSWVTNANRWSIFIPMTISTEDKKSVYAQLGELDKAIDSADSEIERLTTRIDELRKKKELDKEETDELIRAEQELTDAQKAKNEAEAKGGHGKKEKKDERAAKKAQKQAESELQKALKDELQLIDKVRSQYKKLTDAGASSGTALTKVTNQFGNSVARINSILGKNGIPLFDISKFAGTDNPHALLDMLKLQLDSAKIAKNIKPEEIKELEVKYSEIDVDADAYDLTKITKGLNNELDRLKDEYELAVSLDADPELGSMFADWMGKDVNDLPRTASEYAERASKELNKYLKENKANVELPNLLNVTDDDLRAFEEMKVLTDAQLENVRKRVQQARELQKKEVSDQIKDWDKLLEKYAEYETKISKIQNDAVKERVAFAQQFGSDEDKSLALKLQTQILAATDPQEKQKLIEQLQNLVKNIAGDDKTKLNIVTAITNSEQQGIAKTNFEEFQKSPEWIAATGDLAGMTTRAIGGLISSLERYKKTAKDLTPKQIKQINNALKSLHKQQRQGNPFLQIADAIDRAKERAEEFQPEMDAIMSDIIALEKEIGDNDPTEEQARHLKSLKDRWKELASVGKVSASEYVDAINNSISAASQAISMFTDMADALGGQHMTEASKTIKDVVGVLEKAGQGAAMGAQIGGGYGAIIGAVAGGLAGAITTWADVWSGNAAITDKVKESERAVKRLTASYSNLEYIASKAYGAIKSGADDALISNKKLQLAELEHQLELEKSRSSKNRDEERIEELTTEITELRNEIKKATTDIVNDILGISDAEDGVVGLVDAMINAFRNGEDAMAAFGDKWDEMIDNMITKLLVTTYMQKAWDNVMATLEQKEAEFIQKASEERANAMKEYDYAFDKSDDEIAHLIAERLGYTDIGSSFDRSVEEIEQEMKRGELNSAYSSYTGISQVWIEAWQRVTDEEIRAYRNMLEQAVDGTESSIDKASVEYTKWSLDYMNNEGREYMTNYAEMLKGALGDWYRYGQDSQNNLSALQQGISQISEQTANSIEAYLNGVSQQVYLHSELLTQIRDAIMGTDSDIQLGVQGQILLQLQTSYQTQQAIQSILEGWSSPNGMSVRVEMV